MEMTTGMSAPPIGMMMSTPSRNDVAVISQKATWLCVSKNQTMNATSASASAMLMAWRAIRMIGLPLMRPDSFRNAIIEPVKVMAPMATPSDISIRLWLWIAPSVPMPKAAGA